MSIVLRNDIAVDPVPFFNTNFANHTYSANFISSINLCVDRARTGNYSNYFKILLIILFNFPPAGRLIFQARSAIAIVFIVFLLFIVRQLSEISEFSVVFKSVCGSRIIIVVVVVYCCSCFLKKECDCREK